MPVPILVGIFFSEIRRFRRIIARPDARALKRHDVFGTDQNRIRIQLPRAMLGQRAKDQLVAAAAPEFGFDERVLFHESSGVGAQQRSGGDAVKLKCALFACAVFEPLLALLRRQLVDLVVERFDRRALRG